MLGQIEGGIAQGLGLAVMEEIVQIDGRIRNASFTDYLLPTLLDMPDVVATLIEEPDPQAPLGAKGVGEPPCISVTPAIVAAIRDALRQPTAIGTAASPASRAPRRHRPLIPASSVPIRDRSRARAADRARSCVRDADFRGTVRRAAGSVASAHGRRTEREIMTWEMFGDGVRDVAQMVADDGTSRT